MAHDTVMNAFLNVGLRQKQLPTLLASNVVLDWFGRTLSGKQRVIDFYLNSNNIYEHNVTSVETTQPFENRSTHMITRKEPEENFEKFRDISSAEHWFDCDTTIDLKESQMTPPRKSITKVDCPPAPCRRYFESTSSDEDRESTSEDDSDLGVYPLDSSFEMSIHSRTEKKAKRQKMNETIKETDVQTTLERESKYSELHYLETTGTVIVNMQATSSVSRLDDTDRKECKLSISYRVSKSNQDDIQIALIIYKPNNDNFKSRRNLLNEFDEKESLQTEQLELMSSTSNLYSTAVKAHPKKPENTIGVNSEPTSNKSQKGTKRPMLSRSRLRF